MIVDVTAKQFTGKLLSARRWAENNDSSRPDTVMRFRHGYYCLAGALLLGLLVRMPGVFWGWNFPTGWYGHHVDEYTHLVNAEMLINPKLPPRWNPHPYPKGLAAHVAVPLIGARLIEGRAFEEKLPPPSTVITLGRIINVLYGTATIFITFLLARLLFGDPRVANFAGWILALGGLHVSQSHYFLSDVPAIFWYLLGTYFLIRESNTADGKNSPFLIAAAFSFGVCFGLKLFLFTLPTLVFVALHTRSKLGRVVHAAVWFFLGFVVVNFVSYAPYDLFKTFYKGVRADYEISWSSHFLLYALELPSVVSFPIALLWIAGSWFLFKRLYLRFGAESTRNVITIILLPLVLYGVLVIFTIAQFPRHLVLLIPWISVVAAWTVVQIVDWLRSRGVRPSLAVGALFLYLAVFVYDGEKVFLQEPRNKAADWLLDNLKPGTPIHWLGHEWMPGFKHVEFPENRPAVVVIEMHRANHYLSGQGLRNSYPTNYRSVFASRSEERLRIFQSLFKGESEYKEVARFGEGYFMPEYTLVDNLLGNRARNYVAEVVIFEKTAGLDQSTNKRGPSLAK